MKQPGSAVLITAFILVLAIPLAAQDNSAVRRIGIFIGANDGGKERVTLKWAVADARRIATTMQDVGGMSPTDSQILVQPRVAEIMGALKALTPQIEGLQRQSRRVEFMFYYSGHSDENGLLIGSESLSYAQLRKAITAVGSDVSIAILDSCASGAFTRQKGGVRVQPFLVDETSNMRGYAYLTSSSENEASQESDTLMASFFTHFMVSGLRGAADSSGDNRVTLNEAYHYAFNETLARTENTRSGPQHPNYDIQLKGSGDLILSDLSTPSASAILPEDLNGRFFIRDSRGQLVAEVTKTSGRRVVLALSPGSYSIRYELDGQIREGTFMLSGKTPLTISTGIFSSRVAVATRARGKLDEAPEPAGSKLEGAINRAIQDAMLTGSDALEILTGLRLPGQEPATDGVIAPLPDTPDTATEAATDGARLPEAFLDVMLWPGMSLLPPDTSHATAITLGLFVSQSWHSTFATVSSIGHVAYGDVDGFSSTGVFTTVAGSLRGASFAGVFNHVSGDSAGLELAGLFNINNGTFDGAQIAGLFNINGGDLRGAQIGVLNFSGGSVEGVQIGLLNYAHSMSGIPIGLVSFVVDGIHEVRIGYLSDNNSLSLSFTNGTSWAYSRFLCNLDFGDDPISPLSTAESGFALGVRLGDDALHLDLELGQRHLGHAGTDVQRLVSAFDFFQPHALPDTVIMVNTGLGTYMGDNFGLWANAGFDLVFATLIDPARYESSFTKAPAKLTMDSQSFLYPRISFGLTIAF